MKRMSILFAIACALLLTGCADEGPTAEELQEKFQRGIHGQGQLVPNESTNNPTGAPSASETPPEYPPRP